MTEDDLPMARSNGAARRRRAPVARSHEEIFDAVDAVRRQAKTATRLAESSKATSDLQALALQRIEIAVKGVADAVDEMKKVVGEELEPRPNGARMGTGLVGFVLRLDQQMSRRLGIYDGWTRTVIGGALTAGVLIPAFWAVFWWLTSSKIGGVLR